MDDIIDIYGDADDVDDQVANSERKSHIDAKNRGQFVELTIEGISVSVPHPDHIAYLERRLSTAENTILQMRGDINRLRQVIREQNDGLRGMRRGLDSKVDRS